MTYRVPMSVCFSATGVDEDLGRAESLAGPAQRVAERREVLRDWHARTRGGGVGESLRLSVRARARQSICWTPCTPFCLQGLTLGRWLNELWSDERSREGHEDSLQAV